jgi:hypothetical protein
MRPYRELAKWLAVRWRPLREHIRTLNAESFLHGRAEHDEHLTWSDREIVLLRAERDYYRAALAEALDEHHDWFAQPLTSQERKRAH